MNDTLRQVLESKEQIVQGLQQQVQKQKRALEQSRKQRRTNEEELDDKQADINKLRQRIQSMKALIESKKPNPEKLLKIKTLKKQLEEKKKNNDTKIQTLLEAKNQVHNLKDKQLELDKKRGELYDKLDKRESDIEDKIMLEKRFKQSKDSVGDLKSQKENTQRKIAKKLGHDSAISFGQNSAEDLDRLIQTTVKINEFEKANGIINEEFQKNEDKLRELEEQCCRLIALNSIIRDKLIHTLGRQRGTSTGTSCFFIKQFLNHHRLFKVAEVIFDLRQQNKQGAELIREVYSKIKEKNVANVSLYDLESANQVNSLNQPIAIMIRKESTEVALQLHQHTPSIDKFLEKLRQKCAKEVLERLKILDIETIESSSRGDKVEKTVQKIDIEIEKMRKIGRLQYRRDDFDALKDLVYQIMQDANEHNSNIYILRLVIEKAKFTIRDVEEWNLTRIDKTIIQIRGAETSFQGDYIKLVEVEKKLKDLQIRMNELIKEISQETHSQLLNQLNERTKQAQELKQKDQELLEQIEGRKSELFKIRRQIEETDEELENLYQNQEISLFGAGGDEEQASEQNKQILQKTDTLMKQFQKIGSQLEPETFEAASELLEQLDGMGSFITGTERKIEDGFQKIHDLDYNLKEMEKLLKNQRINECEQQVKVALETVEKLRKQLEKLLTQLSHITKDQNQLLNDDQRGDLERKKEVSSFSIELQQKGTQVLRRVTTKDELQEKVEQLERAYQEALREKNSPNGKEFLDIRNDCENIKDLIMKEISFAEGELADEILACKEVNHKMILKYKTKSEKYHQCIQTRQSKKDEFEEQGQKLQTFKDRLLSLENGLQQLGLPKDFQQQFQKHVQDIAKNKNDVQQIENQIVYCTRKIKEEADDLDQLENKVVKTMRVEDIYKYLQEIVIQSSSLEDEIEKIDKILRNMEKEVDQFMVKVRSAYHFESESKFKKIQIGEDKLSYKIDEVNKEISSFVSEVSICESHIQNKDLLLHELDDFTKQMIDIETKKDSFGISIEIIQSKIVVLDKKTLTVAECTYIIQDAVQIDGSINAEINQANKIQEEVRKLIQRFKDQTKSEEERLRLVNLVKAKMRDNQKLYKQMKTLIEDNSQKVGEFEVLYKAMNDSDDYHQKKPIIEKKLRNIAQQKAECKKYDFDREKMEQKTHSITLETGTKENGLVGQEETLIISVIGGNESDIDKITDINFLQRLIDEGERVYGVLKVDVKELGDQNNNFQKKRAKVADAEIRQIANKRKTELEGVRNQLAQQMVKLSMFEQQVKERDLEAQKTGKYTVEQQNQLKKTVQKLKEQFDEFKTQFELVEHEIREINAEISGKDLEKSEPLTQLAKEIERLKKSTIEVKDLSFDIEKMQIELQAKITMISSMDTEKKLQQVTNDLKKAMSNEEIVRDAISKVLKITGEYDGYTSGPEDEEFVSVMHMDSKDLLDELNQTQKILRDLQTDVEKVAIAIADKKKEAGSLDSLKGEDIDKINELLGRIEGKFMKTLQIRTESDQIAVGNKDRLSQHDLDSKLPRRKEEVEELDKILNDIATDNNSIREKITAEIENCQENHFFDDYVGKLKKLLTTVDSVEEQAKDIHKNKKGVAFEVTQAIDQLIQVGSDVDGRLDLFMTNLDIKKKIQGILKQVQNLHHQVKKTFDETNKILTNKPKEMAYQPAAGDEVDKMLAEIMNRLGFHIPIKRLGGGYYMFGTKKIFCKIINGKLVVRVGGGYMGIEDFIKQYGQQELEKYNQQQAVEEKLKEVASGKASIGDVLKKGLNQGKEIGSVVISDGVASVSQSQKVATAMKGVMKSGNQSPRTRTTSQMSESEVIQGDATKKASQEKSSFLKKATIQLKK